MPNDLQVKEVKTCACGCGEIPPGGREYIWGHKGTPQRVKKNASSNGSSSIDYRSILAQLELKRDQLDKAIEAVKVLLDS